LNRFPGHPRVKVTRGVVLLCYHLQEVFTKGRAAFLENCALGMARSKHNETFDLMEKSKRFEL
jgi:hypothetical protein